MLLVISGLLGLLAAVNGNVIVYTQETPHVIADEFLDMPASFGPELPLEGLRGFLVVGDPPDGCGNLTAPPHDINFTDKWVVLVGRYNCSFEEKVRNAMAAGYGCTIVHNVNSSELETMSAKNPEGIYIPSVFVSEIVGHKLAEKYTYDKGYYVMVNDDLPFNINTHLLLPFAVVVALCLIVILIFTIVKCIKDRRRARRHRLPKSSLAEIPTCKFSKGDPYDTCAICLDDYQDGERLRVLPCAHAYHAKCVDPWLTQNRRVCPVCKRRVLTAAQRHHDSDSDDSSPLLDSDDHPPTQGGTFEEQSENPFRRAERYLARFRQRQRQRRADQETPPAEDSTQAADGNEEGGSDDTAPLLAPASAAAVSERRERRPRRPRRTAPDAPHTAPDTAPDTAPAPATLPEGDDAPLLNSQEHSINGGAQGEIGVAALPAPVAPPHHVDL